MEQGTRNNRKRATELERGNEKGREGKKESRGKRKGEGEIGKAIETKRNCVIVLMTIIF